MFIRLFSATETAFSSVNKIRLKNLASNGNKKAARALKMSENYDELLSTILVGNNIANILSSSLATVLFTRLIGNSGVTIATIVMTVLVLLFGEISPQKYSQRKSGKYFYGYGSYFEVFHYYFVAD